jgi:hypothetical protein
MDFSFPLFSKEITTKREEESHKTCETLKPSLLHFFLFGDEEGQFFRIQEYQGESDDDPDLKTEHSPPPPPASHSPQGPFFFLKHETGEMLGNFSRRLQIIRRTLEIFLPHRCCYWTTCKLAS